MNKKNIKHKESYLLGILMIYLKNLESKMKKSLIAYCNKSASLNSKKDI